MLFYICPSASNHINNYTHHVSSNISFYLFRIRRAVIFLDSFASPIIYLYPEKNERKKYPHTLFLFGLDARLAVNSGVRALICWDGWHWLAIEPVRSPICPLVSPVVEALTTSASLLRSFPSISLYWPKYQGIARLSKIHSGRKEWPWWITYM